MEIVQVTKEIMVSDHGGKVLRLMGPRQNLENGQHLKWLTNMETHMGNMKDSHRAPHMEDWKWEKGEILERLLEQGLSY